MESVAAGQVCPRRSCNSGGALSTSQASPGLTHHRTRCTRLSVGVKADGTGWLTGRHALTICCNDWCQKPPHVSLRQGPRCERQNPKPTRSWVNREVKLRCRSRESESRSSSSVSLEQGGVIEGTRLRIISYPGEALPLRTRCPSNQLSSRLIQHPHKTVMKGSSGANDDILEHSWEVQGAVEGTLDVAGSKAERVEGLSKGGNEKAKVEYRHLPQQVGRLLLGRLIHCTVHKMRNAAKATSRHRLRSAARRAEVEQLLTARMTCGTENERHVQP